MSLHDLIISPEQVNQQLALFGANGSLDLISSHLELTNLNLTGDQVHIQIGNNSELNWSCVRTWYFYINNMTVGDTIAKFAELANVLRFCVDAGVKKVLLPAASVVNLQTLPSDLLMKIQPIFYADPIDVVFRVVGAN